MRILLALILLVISADLSAQLNDRHIYLNAKANAPEVITIESVNLPKIKIHDYSLTDSFGFNPNPIGPNLYQLNLQTIAGYFGDLKTVIEYTEPSSIPGLPQTNYSILNIKAKASKVTSEDDYILHNGSTTIIEPLTNDSSTDGPMTLTKLGHVSGGTASIDSNGNIEFVPSSSSGSIIYFAKDTVGTVTSGLILLAEENASEAASLEIFAVENKASKLILPSADFVVEQSPTEGVLEQIADTNVWTYIGNNGYSGADTFSFSTAVGGLIEYTVEVINSVSSNSFVVDDEVFVPTDGTVTFDVIANDLNPDGVIVYYSPELTELSTGVYQYTSTGGFTGDKQFEYKVFTGIQLFTGYIDVHVDDFAPIEEVNYTFELVENQSIKITHQSPIGDYMFDYSVPPTNGSIYILDEFGEEMVECELVTGPHTIIYTPNAGYAGTDDFEIQYCPNTINCEIVKIDLLITDSDNTDCLCINNCVYAGDHNDDGKVDYLDILDLGLNVGEGGNERVSDFDEVWTGQFSTDWGYGQMGSNIDLKCGDSDGDGYIDEEDLNAINTNYGKVSRLQSELLSATTDVPVYFVPQQTEVDSGEVLTIDIYVGDHNYPSRDMNGLAFSFNIAPELIDSAGVNFTSYEDSWLGYNGPLVNFFRVPQDGKVDIAITRLGRAGANGHGLVGSLDFIVEDVIEGLKRAKDSKGQFAVQMKNILSIDKYGHVISHPDYTKLVSSGSNDNSLDETIDFAETVYSHPNPTQGAVTIISEVELMDKVSIHNVLGQVIQETNIEPTQVFQTDLMSYQEGIYFIKVFSKNKVTTQKVHKVDL